MLEVNKDNFEKEVIQEEGLIVVDFWGPRCEPCKALLPAMEKLANKYAGQVKFCKLNTAENLRLAISQQVLGLPAVIIYKDGKKIVNLAVDFNIVDVESKLKELLAN